MQPGRLPVLFCLLLFFPVFHNDIQEPPFDGPRPHLNIAYFAMYLRMFSYVYFLQSVPLPPPPPHTQTNRRTDVHSSSVLFSFKGLTAGVPTTRGLSKSVARRALAWLGVVTGELHNVHAGTGTHPCAPASAVSQIRSLPVGRRWCGSKNKLTRSPERKRKVPCIPL